MNIEAHLTTWLSERLDVPVSVERRRGDPPAMVTVSRVGGPDRALAPSRPLVAVQCWGAARYEASELAYLVASEMHAYALADGVCSVEPAGTAWFPSEEGEPRYQLTYEIATWPW